MYKNVNNSKLVANTVFYFYLNKPLAGRKLLGEKMTNA